MLWIIKVTSVQGTARCCTGKKEFCYSTQPLKSSFTEEPHQWGFTLLSQTHRNCPSWNRLAKAPKPAWRNMLAIVRQAWHIFHILPEMRNGIRSCERVSPGAVPRTVLMQQPRWQAQAGSGLRAALPTLSWMEMLEQTQLLPAAKDWLSCPWLGGRSVRQRLLCLSLLCSPPGSSDNKRDELLLADGGRKCASAQRSRISAKRERANSCILPESSAICSFCTASNCTRMCPWGQTTFGCTFALVE